MQRIRALIVDDEPFARERVRRLLADDSEVEVVGEASDGFQAVEAIRKLSPNLLFLDVQMPGKDGFSVLDDTPPDQTPIVIFLTAYDTYAVRAFERAALDYLLKPFDEERFARAVGRAKAQLKVAPAATDDDRSTEITPMPKESGTTAEEGQRLERVIVKSGERVFFIKAGEIDWIEAYGNYVRLHVERSAYLLRETISNLEAQLDPDVFVRIHRSALVRLGSIREMQPQFNGSAGVILRDGTRLTLSRRYRSRLPQQIREAL